MGCRCKASSIAGQSLQLRLSSTFPGLAQHGVASSFLLATSGGCLLLCTSVHNGERRPLRGGLRAGTSDVFQCKQHFEQFSNLIRPRGAEGALLGVYSLHLSLCSHRHAVVETSFACQTSGSSSSSRGCKDHLQEGLNCFACFAESQ